MSVEKVSSAPVERSGSSGTTRRGSRPQLQLLGGAVGLDQPLRPDADQPDAGAVQAQGVEQRAGGVVELLTDVGRHVQGA